MEAAPLPPSTAPKAQLIARQMRARIAAQEWLQGERIPDEADLALEYGAARATVNKALQMLAGEGLLERKRRAGTRVAVNPVRKAIISIPIVREQIEQEGMAFSYRLIAQKRAPLPPEIAREMDIASGREMLHLRAVYYGDGIPRQFEERWIDPAILPQIGAVDLRRFSANEWLVQNVTYTRSEIRFYAENADRRDARMLNVQRGAALLILRRNTWNEEGAITSVRIAHHPGFTLAPV